VDVRNVPAIRLYKGLGLTAVEHKVRLFKSVEGYKATITIDFAKLFDAIAVQPDSVILDVATGAGTIPELLGEHLVAMDVSYDILKAAKSIYRASWICGDAREMPIRRDVFDLVTIFAGLMFIPGRENKVRTLAECFGVLKKQGKLILIEPKIQDAQSDLPISFNVMYKGEFIRQIGVGTKGEGLKQTAESLKDILKGLDFSVFEEYVTSEYFVLYCMK